MNVITAIFNWLNTPVIIGGKTVNMVSPSKSPVAFWAAITKACGLPYKLINHQFEAFQVLNTTSSKILLTVYRQKGEGSFKVYFNLMGKSKSNFNVKTCDKGQAIAKALKACHIKPYNGLETDGKGYFITLPIKQAPDVKQTFNVECIQALNNWALAQGTTSRQTAVKGEIIQPNIDK